MAWVMEHFIFLDPHQKDYRSLLDAAVKFRSASRKFGVLLDPWNALESLRAPSMSETDYIGRALTDVVSWVRDYKLHMWIVAHPAKMLRDSTGARPVPTPYDISGSAHWFNKADNIITVHRPDMHDDVTEIHVQKVRFKNLGRVGGGKLRYNRVTGQYHDIPTGFKLDARAEPPPEVPW
jgi:twinkle protein